MGRRRILPKPLHLATDDRAAEHMRWGRIVGTAGSRGAIRIVAEVEHTIIHHDGAGNPYIDGKLRGNADQEFAFFDQLGRQRSAFRPKYIGGAARVSKTWKIDRFIDKLDPDQGAPSRQDDRCDVRKSIEGHVPLGIGRIRLASFRTAVDGRGGKHEARAEGMRRTKQTSDIHRLADAFNADPEITAHDTLAFR